MGSKNQKQREIVLHPKIKSGYVTVSTLILTVGLVVANIFPKGSPELWLNQHYHIFLDYLFYIVTEAGTGYFYTLVAVAFLFYRYSIALTLGVQGLMAALVTNVLKHWVFTNSPRPPAYFADHNMLHFIAGSPIFYNCSFPSGHSLTIFVLCTTLSILFHNKFSWYLLPLALLVLVSRMYLLRHFLIDVSVGGLIGLSISVGTTIWLFNYFQRRFGSSSLITQQTHANR